MSNTLTLSTIFCVTTSESGHDEVFYTYVIDGGDEIRYPPSGYTSMDANDTWQVNQTYTYNSSLKIKLLDDDNWPSSDDYLGSTSYDLNSGPGVTTVSGNGGQYQITMT